MSSAPHSSSSDSAAAEEPGSPTSPFTPLPPGNSALSESWEMVPDAKSEPAAEESNPTGTGPATPATEPLSLVGRQPDPDGLREVKLSEDGEAVKVVLAEGAGEPPAVMSRAYVTLKGKLADGTVFTDSGIEEVDFVLGRGEVATGLQMAVATMLPGERARVHCGVKFGYSDARRPKNVPAKQALIFEVTYLWSEKEKNLHEMEMKDKLEFAQQRREIGRRQFQDGKVASALKQYEKALLVIGDGLRPDGDADKELVREVNLIWVVHLNNAALCHSKLGHHADVVRLSDKALSLDRDNVKSLLRRAESHRYLTDYEESLRDFKRAIAILAAAPEPDTDLIDKIKEKVSVVDRLRLEQTKKHMKTFSNMFKQELYDDKPVQPPSAWTRTTRAVCSPFRRMADAVRGWCRKPRAKRA